MGGRKKLIVHIGTHKTGSSTIQQFLKSNSEVLKKENINVLKFRHREIMTVQKYDKTVVRDISDDIDSSLEDQKTNVISFEGFAGDLSNYYSNYKIVAKMLYDCTSGFDTKIVVFFRRQDQFIQSAYVQLKHQGSDLTFNEFFERSKLENFDWLKFSGFYEKLFGKDCIECIPYSPERFENESIINVFGKIIGSEFMENEPANNVYNVGFSKAALSVFSAVKDKISEQEQKVLRRRLQKKYNNGLFRKYYLLDSLEEKYLNNKFHQSNKILAEKYWEKNYLELDKEVKNVPNEFNPLDIYQDLLAESLRNELKMISNYNSAQAKLDRYRNLKPVRLLKTMRSSLTEIISSNRREN